METGIMKKLTALAIVFATVLVPTTVQAGHDTPLLAAACAYRDAVVGFERHVIRSRYISRYDVRLVDDLEDTTSTLRSAARDPFRGDRFSCAWEDVNILHRRVDSALFGRSCSTRIDPALARCWETVTCALRDLAREVDCLRNPGHRRFDSNPVPSVPQYRFDPTPAPPIVVPQPHTYVPAPSHPAVVPPRTSVHFYRSHGRTIDRPSIYTSRSMHGDRHYDRSISRYQGYAPTSHHDIRAAMVGALLTRMMSK